MEPKGQFTARLGWGPFFQIPLRPLIGAKRFGTWHAKERERSYRDDVEAVHTALAYALLYGTVPRSPEGGGVCLASGWGCVKAPDEVLRRLRGQENGRTSK